MLSFFPSPAGPRLPPFKTFLIKGAYHPSAPVHLCLSSTALQPRSKALLLTSSRCNFKNSLQAYNDDWLSMCSGHGKISEISSRIEVFYPPSPAHLALVLTLFRLYDQSEGSDYDVKTTLDTAPALIVLHEPSAYFMTDDAQTSHTASSYLSLITHALACITFLSANINGPGISFALFDSQLDRLKLPILRPSTLTFHDQEDDSAQSQRLESMAGLAQKYFEWVGIFDKVNSHDVQQDNPDPEHERSNRLRLYPTADGDGNHGSAWEWTEYNGPERGSSERRGTLFSWTM